MSSQCAHLNQVREVTPTIEPFASASKIEKVYMPLKTKQTQMLGNGDAKAVDQVVKQFHDALFFRTPRSAGRAAQVPR